jgi:hypothetical protein
MVTLVVVEPALDVPVHVDRRDPVVDHEVLLDRSRRVEEHRLGTEVDPELVPRLRRCGLGTVAGG